MLIPFFFIRVPRLVLHALARFDDSGKWPVLEYLFRKYTVFAYAPVAILFQVLGAAFVYCPVSVEGLEDVVDDAVVMSASCVPTYIIIWIILIIMFSVSDFLLWIKVIEPYLKEYKEEYDAKN